jgi:radical SAM protein with 4Fe4S-binding SPASM domain
MGPHRLSRCVERAPYSKDCFFLSKEMLYPGSRFRMADELLETYLRQLIESHACVPEVTIAWQGGEQTLMGLDLFRRSVELTRQFLQPGQRAAHTLQTNGTLLDEEWAAFFKENDFLVGLSIDGPRELHDAYRVNKGGKRSFDQVMRGLAYLRDAGVEWNALTTIHAANAEQGGDVYRFLRDECGARFIQFIPIIERVAEADEDGRCPGARGATGRSTRRKERTSPTELVSSPKQQQFGLDKRETLPQYCLDCDVRFACHGGTSWPSSSAAARRLRRSCSSTRPRMPAGPQRSLHVRVRAQNGSTATAHGLAEPRPPAFRVRYIRTNTTRRG